jgi:hypothetical protein
MIQKTVGLKIQAKLAEIEHSGLINDPGFQIFNRHRRLVPDTSIVSIFRIISHLSYTVHTKFEFFMFGVPFVKTRD